MINTKPNYVSDNSNLEDTLKSSARSEKAKELDSILDHDQFYKNCMYCGRIYKGNYDKVIYQNGTGPLGREFNEYNISTGVGPCCMDIYKRQFEEVRKYNSKRQ